MKSTINSHGFPFLLLDIFLNHFVYDIARAAGKISTGPHMTIPELLLQMRKHHGQLSLKDLKQELSVLRDTEKARAEKRGDRIVLPAVGVGARALSP